MKTEPAECVFCVKEINADLINKERKSDAVYVFLDGDRLIAESYIDGGIITGDVEVNYCPMCGKKLEEEQ